MGTLETLLMAPKQSKNNRETAVISENVSLIITRLGRNMHEKGRPGESRTGMRTTMRTHNTVKMSKSFACTISWCLVVGRTKAGHGAKEISKKGIETAA